MTEAKTIATERLVTNKWMLCIMITDHNGERAWFILVIIVISHKAACLKPDSKSNAERRRSVSLGPSHQAPAHLIMAVCHIQTDEPCLGCISSLHNLWCYLKCVHTMTYLGEEIQYYVLTAFYHFITARFSRPRTTQAKPADGHWVSFVQS